MEVLREFMSHSAKVKETVLKLEGSVLHFRVNGCGSVRNETVVAMLPGFEPEHIPPKKVIEACW